jgi:hypothetical protein
MIRRFVLVLALTASGCASTIPTSLSATGVVAFQETRLVKAADILRDFAIDGNAQMPPVVDTATTKKIVEWHKAALLAIQGGQAGWQQAILASLTAIVAALPDRVHQTLDPYVSLITATVRELSS